MKKFLGVLALSIFFIISGCSTAAKTIEASVMSTALSSTIITSLSCANTAVVQADVTTEVNKWFALQGQKGGPVQALCTTAIAQIVPSLIGSTVPATWGCTGVVMKDVANVIATLACSAIPV